MTGELFRNWLKEWNAVLVTQKRRIILFVDNFSGHKIDPLEVPNIRLEFFSPNLTAHVQPCDAGIIRAFKAIYRRLIVLRVVDRLLGGNVPADLFKIDVLRAMYIAKNAWHNVSDATIHNCWLHTKILPEIAVPLEQQPLQDFVPDLQQAMNLLQTEAEKQRISISLVPADKFIDSGEADELAHEHLEIEEIVELIKPSVIENELSLEQDSDIVTIISNKEAFSAMSCLMAYFTQDHSPPQPLFHSLEQYHSELRIKLCGVKKQRLITDFFK